MNNLLGGLKMAEITWIKLKTDMFENEKIKLIEALPDSDTIIVVWVKLLAAAGKANSNGFIMLTENIPMNVEEMATIFNRPLNTVRLALETFKRYGMIEVKNEAIRIKNWENHQNIDGMERVRLQNRERKRKQREKEKQIQLSHVPSRDSHATDLDSDSELDLDKEKDKDLDKTRQDGPVKVESSISFTELLSFYEKNFGLLSAYAQEQFNAVYEEYNGELILEALKETALRTPKVRKPLSFAEGILKNWYQENVQTLEQLKAKRKGGRRESNSASYEPAKEYDDGVNF